METWRERFSVRLRHLKATEGLTQQKLADQLGVAQSTVAGWLHGRREPESLQQFEALAKAIRVHPAWLLYGVDESEEDHELKLLIQALPDDQRKIVRSLAASLAGA